MSAFEEFQAEADLGLATLQDAYALIEQARRVAEDAAAQYRALADESSSDRLQRAAELAEQVPSALDEATGLMIAGVSEFDRYMEEIGGKGSGGLGGAGRGAQVGDQVTAPKLKRGDLEKEHAGTDDGDKEMSRSQRAARAAVRGASDLKKQGEGWTNASSSHRPAVE